MAHQVLDPGFRSLLDENVAVRKLATDFVFTEGPIWHPKGQISAVLDIPAAIRRRWDKSGVRRSAEPFQQGQWHDL